MKRKSIILALLLCSIVAGASRVVEFREKVVIVPGNDPIGCNTVFIEVEQRDFGVWHTVGIFVKESTCNTIPPFPPAGPVAY